MKEYPGKIDRHHTRCTGAYDDDFFSFVIFGSRVIVRVNDLAFEFSLDNAGRYKEIYYV